MTNATVQQDAGSLVEAQAETPAHLKNDKRFSDMMKNVRKFGEEASLGRDSLPKLAQYVVKNAAEGVIDTETKNAKGEDAATIIYDAYVKAESNKAIHEHSAGGKKANVSKLRQLIKVGNMTGIDAIELMQDAFDAREAMQQDDNKVKAAYPFYVEVARAQLDAPNAQLERRVLERLACKGDPKEKTIEGELKRALKILEDLVSGEGKVDQDTDELTEAAFHAVKDRLFKIENGRQVAKLMVEAAKLGVKLG